MGNKASSDKSAAGAAGSPEEDAASRDFKLEVCSAKLSRSFAKVGKMNPYVIVTVEEQEVFRTPVAKGGHKDPSWGAVFASRGLIPDSVTISVWDKNSFHKDVFCGAVTMPCSSDMGRIEGMELELQKREKPTGIVIVTLDAENGEAAPRSRPPATTGGAEMDLIINYVQGKQAGASEEGPLPSHGFLNPLAMVKKITMRSRNVTFDIDDPDSDIDNDEAAPVTAGAAPLQPGGGLGGIGGFLVLNFAASEVGAAPAPGAGAAPAEGAEAQGPSVSEALGGGWKCVATQGLEEFLKATGQGMFQRKMALAAAWPRWVFEIDAESDQINFTNHTAIGILREEVPIGGRAYTCIDGRNNKLNGQATWTTEKSGGKLLITKSGPLATYTEERTVTGDSLEFVLTNGEFSWGRTFARECK